MTTSSGLHQRERIGSKAVANEEIVKHMSNLPSYLERGKHFQDKALNFGVMDWGCLEKWQYNHKQVPCKSSKYSASSSNSSSFFSTDGSSTYSSRAHSCSPAHQKLHRPTLQSHLNGSPKHMFAPSGKSSVGNPGKFQDFKDAPGNFLSGQKSTLKSYKPFHSNQLEIKQKECKMKDSYQQIIPKKKVDPGSCSTMSSSKGKMKIQGDESIKETGSFQEPYYSIDNDNCLESHKTVVLLLPRDGPDCSQTNGRKSTEARRRSFSEVSHFKEIYHSDVDNNIPRSCRLQSEVLRGEHSRIEPNTIDEKSISDLFLTQSSARIPTSPSRSKKLEEKKGTVYSKCSATKMDSVASSKVRSLSPLRRFTIGMSKIGKSSISGDSSTIPQLSAKSVTSKPPSDKAEASASSHNSTKDNPSASSRGHSSPSRRTNSSPLRRLLEPLFPSKATNTHQSAETSQEDSTIKVKSKLDLGSCKEISIEDSLGSEKSEASTTQALFQVAIKNGRPLFTFAVENQNDILAATVKRLSSSGKDGNSWIYTFFTVHEVKKKNSNWLKPGSEAKNQNYVPNIAAQMKVSDLPNEGSSREFILFAVGLRPSDHQILDVQPQDELAAIVCKLPNNDSGVGSEELFRTTVILPGGDHGVPSKGEPSPLIVRWRSGGLCDCGGWDTGCRLRILANHGHCSSRSSSTGAYSSIGRFQLFSQGEVPNERPFFMLSPLKEGIFSVEFNLDLSLLQAFSVCISVLDCQKSSQLSESSDLPKEKSSEETTELTNSRKHIPSHLQEYVPVIYASYPPLSPVGRA